MKILKYLLLIPIVGIVSNCTDLEEDVYTFLAPTNFYSNAEDLNMALIGVYDGYQNGFARNSRGWYMILEVATEFNSPAYTINDPRIYNAWVDVNNASRTIKIWGSSYSTINKANVVLARGLEIEMDETEKKRIFAEARFLRAATYYNLVRIYGGVPIPENMTEGLEGLEIPRKTVDEVYDYLIADLEYAIQNLPPKSEYTSDEIWRVSKGSAQGMLGEVYLTRGSMTGNDEYFTLCKQYCDSLMQSGECELEPDYKDLWYWWNTGNENGIESVFEIQIGRYFRDNLYFGSAEYSTLHRDGGIFFTDPSLGAEMWNRYTVSFSHYFSYSDNDVRKEAFLTEVYTASGDTIYWLPEDKGFYPGTQGWTSAGPGNKKYYDRSEESALMNCAGTNVYIMRYSDVLLNYAEAENELNGPTTEAYNEINKVRNRVNLPGLTPGLTKEQFADSIYRERGWEFIGEAQLYFDGLRTDRIGENVKAHVVEGVNQGLFLYQPLEHVPTKNFLWKIPEYDFDSNPALEQNLDNVSAEDPDNIQYDIE